MATVAVVTPIYATPENGRLELFRHTLRSVQQQTHHNVVYLVVDDGSTADVQKFLRESRDSRVRYIRREKFPTDLKTASNALNLGIDCCIGRDREIFSTGEAEDLAAVAFLHSDDLFVPNSVELRIKNLQNGFVFTDMALFTSSGKIPRIRYGDTVSVANKTYATKNPREFNHHTIMWSLPFLRYLREFTARKYNQYGVFDPRLFHGEDRDISLSSSEAAIEGNLTVNYAPFVSVIYRTHPKSISGETLDEDVAVQGNLISLKHFGREEINFDVEKILDRMLSNPPWSIGAFLPERMKKRIRPIRDFIGDIELHATNPKLWRSLEDCITH